MTRQTITLTEPHVVTPDSPYLNSSGEIAGYRFELDPAAIGPRGFPTGTLGRYFGHSNPYTAFGLLSVAGPSGLRRIVDCEFVGPWSNPTEFPVAPPGGPDMLRGIQLLDTSGIAIEGCQFRGLPWQAIQMHGSREIQMEDVWVKNCSQALHMEWWGPRCRHIEVNRLHAQDSWNKQLRPYPEPRWQSIYDPSYESRFNVVSGYCADSTFSRMSAGGEFKSLMKLVGANRVRVEHCDHGHLMNQGTLYWNHTDDPALGNGRLGGYNPVGFDESPGWHCDDLEYFDCTFRPSSSAAADSLIGPTLQISYPQTNVRFRKCTIHRPFDPERWAAIALNDGASIDIRDSLVLGYQGPDDPRILYTGTYAPAPGSIAPRINEDWQRVNRFLG